MQLPMFELNQTTVLFSHMNLRQEKHGEDSVLAVDLKMSFKATNDVLAMLHPSLKSRLYKRPDAMGADLVSQAGGDELIAYCFPQMESIKWAHEQYNNVVTFPYGLDGKNDIVLDDAKVNSFTIECFDGGTVELSWKVQSVVTPEQIKGLSNRLETGKVEVSIVHVEPEEAQQALSNAPEQNPVAAAGDDDDDEIERRPVGRGGGRRRRGNGAVAAPE